MATGPGPHELDSTFLIYTPEGSATPKEVSPTFFEELGAFTGGFLVSRFAFEEAWSTWEMHPEGDEFVYLVEGDTSFILRTPEGETTLRVDTPGTYVVVPKGAWHTARPHAPTTMLFVTPGEGTETSEAPPI